jgi:hypothetical protein
VANQDIFLTANTTATLVFSTTRRSLSNNYCYLQGIYLSYRESIFIFASRALHIPTSITSERVLRTSESAEYKNPGICGFWPFLRKHLKGGERERTTSLPVFPSPSTTKTHQLHEKRSLGSPQT